MSPITIIGTIAAICSTVSFAPQAWQVIKTRKTKDISAAMYAFTVTGFLAWTTYGVLLEQWPLIVANSICLALSGFILAMKLLPQRDKNKVADKIAPKA
ncbi:MAG: SemiSWEET transporter [Alphaproteobacteria bacterium]|nr:SemiSWEET transporter [Alphaproteobacteria bacterium]MBV9418457.1 SemiSWEET transporter [Alphaproteobacteria bacterium]MBV9540889.1 SemiSWEET transporter [Alphaproteobacteria bacterium]MBV9904027.1 SemiSWEET transporter [Alphaproteobacteria bacterium]